MLDLIRPFSIYRLICIFGSMQLIPLLIGSIDNEFAESQHCNHLHFQQRQFLPNAVPWSPFKRTSGIFHRMERIVLGNMPAFWDEVIRMRPPKGISVQRMMVTPYKTVFCGIFASI